MRSQKVTVIEIFKFLPNLSYLSKYLNILEMMNRFQSEEVTGRIDSNISLKDYNIMRISKKYF